MVFIHVIIHVHIVLVLLWYYSFKLLIACLILRMHLHNKLFISYMLLSGYNMEIKLTMRLESWLQAAVGKNTKSNQNNICFSQLENML